MKLVMFNVLFQLLFFGDPPQTDIGATNTINSFAEPRNANGASVNTTTPPEPMVNSINSWAEVRNAEVGSCHMQQHVAMLLTGYGQQQRVP